MNVLKALTFLFFLCFDGLSNRENQDVQELSCLDRLLFVMRIPKLRLSCLIPVLGLIVAPSMGHAQYSAASDSIFLGNPSFEEVPRAGGSGFYRTIRGWQDCGESRFPEESPPDIHPVPGAAWGVTKKSHDGTTYLGMVVRDDETWESVSQALSGTLKAGECYAFSVWLCRSDTYFSARTSRGDSLYPFTRPAVLRIFGGNGLCSESELLAESEPVRNTEWTRYAFKLEPSRDYRHITLQAFYKTPVLVPYNGHLLVDNIAPIIHIPCHEDNISDVFEEKEEEEINPVNASPSSPVKPPATSKVTPKPPAATPPKPVEEDPGHRYLTELDRSKLEQGKTIRIERLYFKADSSSIEEASHPVLEEIARFLKRYPEVVIEIGGHTNTIPGTEYCNTLSTNRAKSVVEFLIEEGVPKRQLQYKGYGKTKPIVPDDVRSRAAQAKNQRVEIKVLSVG